MANPPVVIPARFPRFYTAGRNVVQEALERLRPTVGEPLHWPTKGARRIVFEANRSHFEEEHVEIPENSLTLISGELQRSEQYRAAVRELELIEEQGQIVPNFIGLGPQYIDALVSSYLRIHRALDLNDEHFRQAYYPIEEFLAANAVRVKIYFTLPGLIGDVDEVCLSPSHRIYRLNPAEINRLWRVVEPPWYPVVLRPTFGTYPQPDSYILSSTIEYPKTKWNELSLFLQNEEIRATRALRISAPGAGALAWFTYEHIGFAAEFGRIGVGESRKAGTYVFRLNGETAECLQQHWGVAYELSETLRAAPLKIPTHIRIAAQRFSGSSDKLSLEDQVIDFSIALEALLTKEKDAISYRLPLRGSMLAGDTPEERQRVFSILKAGYDIRSSLAHGHDQLAGSVKVGSQKVEVSTFIKDLRDVLFKILHRLMRVQKIHGKDATLKLVDDSLISWNRDALERLWQ